MTTLNKSYDGFAVPSVNINKPRQICARGEIAKLKSLKMIRREPCQLESDRAHHKEFGIEQKAHLLDKSNSLFPYSYLMELVRSVYEKMGKFYKRTIRGIRKD